MAKQCVNISRELAQLKRQRKLSQEYRDSGRVAVESELRFLDGFVKGCDTAISLLEKGPGRGKKQ